MYVCMYVCEFTFLMIVIMGGVQSRRVCVYVCMCVWGGRGAEGFSQVCVCVRVCACVCVCVCMHACMYVRDENTHACVYACMYVHDENTHVCVCMHVCMYVHDGNTRMTGPWKSEAALPVCNSSFQHAYIHKHTNTHIHKYTHTHIRRGFFQFTILLFN
jgi:hypothetical protein